MCEVCRMQSGMLWCVMRSADLLLGCVGGSLSLSQTSVDLSCIIYTMYLCYYWTCVWGPPACSWAVSVGLSKHCFAVVCVRSTDLPVGCVGGSLMHRLIYCIWCDVCELSCIIWYVMVCDEVCRPAPGLCRWVSLSVTLSQFVVVCVGSAEMGYVGGSLKTTLVGLSCIVLIFMVCVRSTDLLLGCVGGSLISRILIFNILFCCDMIMVLFLIWCSYRILMSVQ